MNGDQLSLDLSPAPQLPKIGQWVDSNFGFCKVYWVGGSGSVIVMTTPTVARFADWWAWPKPQASPGTSSDNLK